MVQLSAAGLGVPTDNVGAGLSQALQMGTQGFMQGAQLKLQQDKAKREQAAYEQALKEAQFKFSQEQGQAAAQEQGGALLGDVGNFKPDSNVIGPPTEQGLLPASAATHKADFEGLQQHHAQVWQQATALAGKMDPRFADRFLGDIKAGMGQDALNLQRVHTADDIHDGAMKGWFDTVDPASGERVPNEQMRQQMSDLADRVRAGEIDPVQVQQFIEQTKQKINQEEGDVKHRLMVADEAGQKLLEMGSSATPEAISMVGALRTGQLDMDSWKKVAPYVLAGMVQGPSGHWLTPQDAAVERQQMMADLLDKQQSAREKGARADYTAEEKAKIEREKIQATKDAAAAKNETARGMNLDRIKADEAKTAASGEQKQADREQKQSESDKKDYASARASVDKRLKDQTLQAPMDPDEKGYDEWYQGEVDKAYGAAKRAGGAAETPQERLARLKAKNGMK